MWSGQFVANNGDGGATGLAGEEVTELLMKSIVDDKRMQEMNQRRRERALSYSSDNSFSFRADALRSHTNYPSEATKLASRSDLSDRINQLIKKVTSICLHATPTSLPKDFLISFMSMLMGQLQSSQKQNDVTFFRDQLIALVRISMMC